MHFQLFVPNLSPAEVEKQAKTLGIADLFGGQDTLPNISGPGDSMGTMIGWLSPENPRMNYEPDRQAWMPSIQRNEGKPVYWVGINTEKPPRENELRRSYTQDGTFVKLGRERWKLPTPSTVDARAVYADDGSMRWEVVRQFAWVCDEAKQLQDEYMENSGARMFVFGIEPSAQINWLLKLLRINYRMTPELAVHLDLWTGRNHVLDTFLQTLGLSRKVEADV